MIDNTVKGDLIKRALQDNYDAIVHGCNCHNTMGSGIAKFIRVQWPEVYEADCKTKKGDRLKLGTYSKAVVKTNSDTVTVINAYTQYNYNAAEKPIDYDAVRLVFSLINKDFAGKKVGIPKIGAGLAGGDWDRISAIINKVTPDVSIELVEFGG